MLILFCKHCRHIIFINQQLSDWLVSAMQYLEKGGQNAAKGAEDRIRCYG